MSNKPQRRRTGSTQKRPRPETGKSADTESGTKVQATDFGKLVLEPVSDPLVFDILTETTRRCRKSLLAVSLVCFTVTWGDLFPKEVSAFGFKVDSLQRVNLLYVLAMVAAYYSLAFVVYCYSDGRLRKVRKRLDQLRIASESDGVKQRLDFLANAIRNQKDKSRADSPEFLALASASSDRELAKDAERASAIRQVIDIHLPVLAGLGAITVVVQEAGQLPGFQVLVVFSLFVLLLVGLTIRQSEKYRIQKKLAPLRGVTNRLQSWVKLQKKYNAVPPNSLRARYYKWRLSRTKFGPANKGKDAKGQDA